MTTVSPNNRLDDVAILRTVAIIGVVLYHAFWALYFAENTEEYRVVTLDFVTPVYESFFRDWLGARMPLFIFISGYLYSYLYNIRGKYQSTPQFIKKKFTHLIIPYIIFSLLMALTLWNLTWEKFTGGYMHLWFILMIFWCFVFIRLFGKIKNNLPVQILIFILFSIGYSIPMNRVFFGLDIFLKFFCWFWLGYIVLLNREKVKFIFRKESILGFFFIWLACCSYIQFISPYNRIGEDFTRDLVLYFSHIAFIFFIYTAVNKALFKGWIKMKPWIEEVNRCSYGIYVFHLWIVAIIVFPFRHTEFFEIVYRCAVNYPLLAPMALFVLTFFIPLYISKFLLKTKVGRFLIG